MYASCYIVFNNDKTIGQSLKSVLPYVEKVIIVDGAFETYPHKVPWSTDNTKSIAEKLCGKKLIWVKCEKPWTQIEKRNQYLKRIPIGEHFIITDSDDILKGDVEADFKQVEEKLCVGVRCVKFYPKWRGSYLDIPEEAWTNLEWTQAGGISCRIYRKQENMKYRHHHSTIYVKNQIISRSQRNLKNMFLYSLHIKTWREYIADIIYRITRPSSKTGRRHHILERYTGGKEPSTKQLINITSRIMPGFKISAAAKKVKSVSSRKRRSPHRTQSIKPAPQQMKQTIDKKTVAVMPQIKKTFPSPITMPFQSPRGSILASEQKVQRKVETPKKISIIQKWSYLIEINRSVGKPWNTGFPYTWHREMRPDRFLMELPKHLGQETRW